MPGATPIDAQDVAIAIGELGEQSAVVAEMIQLRYFFGLEDQEISALLEVSVTSVERTMRLGKAWLSSRLSVKAIVAAAEPESPSPGM